jgi:adenosylcobinamide-phosphate synthase
MHAFLSLPLGFVLDQILGDPPSWPHPVRWIGRLIVALEAILRRLPWQRLAGVLLLLLVVSLTAAVAWSLLELAALWSGLAATVMAVVLIYFGIASRSLARETRAVLEACRREDWDTARQRLSRIVGRDTAALSPEEIYRACIETVAENTTDAVVAPLLYAALAGPVGMWAFKAVSTLDSMVGYRNKRYLRFGWASARADDVANFLPARLTYLLMSLAALLRGQSMAGALATGWRDSRKHPSPNAAWAEATMAGALAVRLGGPSSYDGTLSDKPHLGDGCAAPALDQAETAVQIMLITSGLALVFCCGLQIVLAWFLGRL